MKVPSRISSGVRFRTTSAAGGGACPAVSVSQFPAGHSNLTYLVRFGGREMVLRRAPRGVEVRTAHDMSREFEVLSALSPLYSKAPKALAYCDDASVSAHPSISWSGSAARSCGAHCRLPASTFRPHRCARSPRTSSTSSPPCTRSTSRRARSRLSESPTATPRGRCRAGRSDGGARRPTRSPSWTPPRRGSRRTSRRPAARRFSTTTSSSTTSSSTPGSDADRRGPRLGDGDARRPRARPRDDARLLDRPRRRRAISGAPVRRDAHSRESLACGGRRAVVGEDRT